MIEGVMNAACEAVENLALQGAEGRAQESYESSEQVGWDVG